MAFTKLDSGIVDSSLWAEPLATRIVFVTMLAKKNYKGEVLMSHSGLLRASNISSESDFNAAIVCLESPDADSRSPEFDGKRIEKIPGGWKVLNHYKYREYTYSDNPESIRKREYRSFGTSRDMSRNQRDISVSVSSLDSLISDSLRRVWEEYLKMRVRIRKPATDRAKELVLERLEKLAPGDDIKKGAILEQSIENSWQGVFPLRTDRDQKPAGLTFNQAKANIIAAARARGEEVNV